MNKQMKILQKPKPVDNVQPQKKKKPESTTAVTQVDPTPILQRAYDDPSTLTSADAKILQRTIGNRAVRRLVIQRKMTVGPANDRYEQEADTVAKQVVNTLSHKPIAQRQEDEDAIQMKLATDQWSTSRFPPLSISRLQRQEDEEEIQTDRDPMLGGGELSGDMESSVQNAKSSGRPLDDNTRHSMEQAFNADFSGVKVHTSGQSDTLNRAMSARAFTSGQDVFFRSGAYNPHNANGQELLAHELTHVVQQTGSTQARRQVTKPHQAATMTPMPQPTIQRLINREGMERLAGEPSKKAVDRTSTYVQLLEKLDEYQKIDSDNQTAQESKLQEILKLTTSWLESHTKEIKQTVGDEVVTYRKATKKEKMRKAMFIQSLEIEVQAELAGTSPEELAKEGKMAPSLGIEFYKQSKEDAEKLETTETTGDKFQVSVLASVENPLYFQFAKKRLELRSSSPFKDKSGIKKQAAESVIDDEYKGLDDLERKKKVEELVSKSGEVGHSWVKLTSKGGGSEPKEHSFGFYPLFAFNHPEVAVPGKVVYPDKHHDSDPNQRRLDFDVPKDKYQQAMAKASSKMKSPDDYTLTDYNCTTFAKEITKEAGASFPEKSFLRVPITWATKLAGWAGKEIMDPNSLYNTMTTNLGDKSYNPYEIKQQQEEKETQILEWLRSKVTLNLYGDYASRHTMTKRNIEKRLTGEDIIEAVEAENGDVDAVVSELYSEDGLVSLVIFEEGQYKVHKSEYEQFVDLVKHGVKERASLKQSDDEPSLSESPSPETPESSAPSGLSPEEMLQEIENWQGQTVELVQDLSFYKEVDGGEGWELVDTIESGFAGQVGYTINGITELEIDYTPYWVKPAELYKAVNG